MKTQQEKMNPNF